MLWRCAWFRLTLWHALKSVLQDVEELNRKAKDDAFWWRCMPGMAARPLLVRNSRSAKPLPLLPEDAAARVRDSIREIVHGDQGQARQAASCALSDAGRDADRVGRDRPCIGFDQVDLERRDLVATARERHLGRGSELASVRVGEGTAAHEMLTGPDRGAVARIAQVMPGRGVVTGPLPATSTARTHRTELQTPAPTTSMTSATARCRCFEYRMPQFMDRTLADSEAFTAVSDDGFETEASLTSRVATPTGKPCVIIPAGGPMGVFVSAFFDPEVQFSGKSAMPCCRRTIAVPGARQVGP